MPKTTQHGADEKTTHGRGGGRGKTGLVATVAQSRFHKDAHETDDPASKDITIKDLTLTISQKELLSHADLHLRSKVHYVLVGRNGTGKSTLFDALNQGIIPGVASGIKILMLGQDSVAVGQHDDAIDDGNGGNGSSAQKSDSVLDCVLRSDRTRDILLAEQKLLSEALDNHDDPLSVVRAMRTLNHQDLTRAHAKAVEIANFRSGARGLKARQTLIAVEAQVAASEELLSQSDDAISPEAVAIEMDAAVARLTKTQLSLSSMDSDGAENRAMMILKGLGFKQERIEGRFEELSGGWRTRCLLAGVLFQSCDVLLLDECTNFLDLPAIMWLENYIQSVVDRTIVIIAFGDAVAEELIVLREQNLEHFTGNLSTYERERLKRIKWMSRMKAAQEKSTKHIEATIAGNINSAKRSGNDKALKQAASRRKKLEERTGLQVSAKGGRFKLNRDLAGFHNTKRDAIEVPEVDPPVKLVLPSQPADLRTKGAVVSIENVSFAYPRTNTLVLKEANLVVHPGDRVGLVGLNGTGKSTLIKLIMDASSPGGFKPSKGTISTSARAKIECFSQHCVDELNEKSAANPQLVALSDIIESSNNTLVEQDARALLGGIGLAGRTVSDVPIAALSGGQKVRLALIKLLVQPPHLLILDEVTSHLDSDTIMALAKSLRSYQGAILIVTHDRYFMKTVVEGERLTAMASDGESDDDDEDDDDDDDTSKSGVVYRLLRGRVERLDGGMGEYEAICERIGQRASSKAGA